MSTATPTKIPSIAANEVERHTIRDDRLRYWLYANPFTGEYVSFNTSPPILAVFRSEPHGRSKEIKRNPVFQRCAGHEVSYDEMLVIADEQYAGRWSLSD